MRKDFYLTPVKTERGKNVFQLMFIEFPGVPTIDGNDMIRVLLSGESVFELQKIERRHRGIDLKLDPSLSPNRNVRSSGTLCGISNEECNLKTRRVIAIDVFGSQGRLGGKQEGCQPVCPLPLTDGDDRDIAVQTDAVDDGGIQRALL